MEMRFAFNEKFLIGDFDRISVGTKYPIIGLQYGYGMPDVFSGEYEYHKLKSQDASMVQCTELRLVEIQS
jgi:hypothetical protein